MEKKTKILIISILILYFLVSLSLVFLWMDYGRILKGGTPLFSINTSTYKDGGSEVYYGLGYRIIRWYQLQKDSKIKYGPDFVWMFFYKRSHTNIYSEKELLELGKRYE